MIVDTWPDYHQQISGDHDNVVYGEDIINHLPESILSHILSRLPTKDAVRTSVLSRDWEFKWTLVYNLNFKDEVGLDELNDPQQSHALKRFQFVDFVDRVLQLCSTSTLKRFELSLAICRGFYDFSLVKSWIVNLLWRNAQDVHLVNIPDESAFPRNFFRSGSLVKLKLRRCCLKAPTHVLLSNLRSLNLSDINLRIRIRDLSDPRKLVLTFPVLEVLDMYICKWRDVKILEIDAPRLHSFSMIHPSYLFSSDRSNDCRIEIRQAGFFRFRCWGVVLEHFVFGSPSMAEYVDLQYEIERENNVHWRRRMSCRACALLGGFSAVTRCLEISRDFLVLLADADPPSPFPVLDSLTGLKISSISDTALDVRCNRALVNLLKMVPCLEFLTFTSWRSGNDDEAFEAVDQTLPGNFLSCVKVIRFHYFFGREDEMELVKFLLPHAIYLNSLIIGSLSFGVNTAAEIQNRVRRLPRASSHARVIFSRTGV